MSTRSQAIWMDGKLVDFENATVHFLNRTLHYGAGVFEGIRCYKTDRGPAVFRLKDHIERLFASAHIFSMRGIPFTQDEIVAAVKQTVAANHFEECYIRPLVYFSSNEMGLNLDQGQVSIGVAAWEWGSYLGAESQDPGIRACVSNFTRHHINAVMTKAKVAGNYPNSMMAKTDALRSGFDEAIMLDTCGYVCEATAENIFAVRDNVIYTPPLSSSILNGITRDTLITLARESGYEVREQTFQRDFLYIADEVFFCGTAVELMPVREIDFRPIGEGKPGPVARKLKDLYFKLLRGGLDTHKEWLTYY